MKILVLILFTLAADAATVRLYLKDGTHHSVREFKTEGDRVRYFSTERGEWEEIPLELIDLKKTEAERIRVTEERKQNSLHQELSLDIPFPGADGATDADLHARYSPSSMVMPSSL